MINMDDQRSRSCEYDSIKFFPSNTFDGPRLTRLDVNPDIETNSDEIMYESGI